MSERERLPKKTDAVEVRLSPEEKAKLKHRASQEGLTVSALIRQRLDDVLGGGASDPGGAKRGDMLMFGFVKSAAKLAVSRPRWFSLAGAAAIAALLVAAPPSSAETVRLDVSVQIEQSTDAGDHAVSRANSVTELRFGEPLVVEVRDATSVAGVYRIRVSAQPADAGNALVSSEVLRVDGEAETVLASPNVMVRYGEPAELRIGAVAAPEIILRLLVAEA